MKVLITGGAGFVGRATVRAAVEAGHQVRIVSRDAWPSGSMFERLGVDVVTGDAQRRTVSRRFLGASTVRQLARVNDLFGGRLSPLPAASSIDWILGNADAVDTSRTRSELRLEFRPIRETLADAITWWAAHDMVDRQQAGKLAPTPV